MHRSLTCDLNATSWHRVTGPEHFQCLILFDAFMVRQVLFNEFFGHKFLLQGTCFFTDITVLLET